MNRLQQFICTALCLLPLAISAQYYNPYTYNNAYEYGRRMAEEQQRQQQEAWNYGYRMGQQMQQEQQQQAAAQKAELTKYQRQATWPQGLSHYTKDIRYYKNRYFLVWSNSFSGIPCTGETGVMIRYNGSTPIGCAFIDENGDLIDKHWRRIGHTMIDGKKTYVIDYNQDKNDGLVYISDGGNQITIQQQMPNNSYFLGIYNKHKRSDRECEISMPTLDF